jgi:type VI secretion system secreted protein VgrG
MPLLELSFESKEDSLSVRRFAAHEAMSSLFSVSVWARSTHDDLDLEAFVGKEAALRIVSGMRFALAPERSFTGVVSHMELLQAEATGLSTYYLRIVPRLWLATQRRNHRVFQHKSVPDVVEALLHEWHIEHEWRVHRPSYPKLDMRLQYGESDFDFISRLLEEAGISYSFTVDADQPKRGSLLVLHDAPQAAEPRAGGPLTHAENPNQSAEQEFVSHVRLAQQVRPGRVTLRDHDFRQHHTFKLLGKSPAGKGVEDLLEHYAFAPGSFLVEVEEKGIEELGHLAETALDHAVDKGLHLPGADHGIGKKVAGAVEKKVHGIVDDKVSHFVDKGAHLVGEKVGHAIGGTAGHVVGEVAGKVAGKIAGGVAGSIAHGLAGVLGRLVGDDKGKARHSEKAGSERATKLLESARANRRSVTFETNAIDLVPGTVFSMGGHGRTDLGQDKKLLVTELSLEGAPGEEWSTSAQAVFAEHPHRPPMKTPKPSLQGLQSAVVVGPPGEEIHTDEFGRVRVQFHWDREGTFSDASSCWMRVSQGWAGGGYGMIAVPRVGHEVLVAFLEGDPDNPIVVGRVYNATSRVPWDLPAHRTRSGWRTDSSPGSGGFNEIMFEDAKGHELVRVQAEKDLEKVVKHNEGISVGVDRRSSIGAVDESHVGVRHNVTMKHAGDGGPTFFEMVDKRIHFSTGEASITLDGPNITLQAKGRVFIHSSDDEVEILGGPWVKINCGPVKAGESDTVTMHHVTGVVRDQDGKPLKDCTVVVKASDGAVQQVQTDDGGKYFALVPPGMCEVSLPGGKRYGVMGMNLDTMGVEPVVVEDEGPVA